MSLQSCGNCHSGVMAGMGISRLLLFLWVREPFHKNSKIICFHCIQVADEAVQIHFLQQIFRCRKLRHKFFDDIPEHPVSAVRVFVVTRQPARRSYVPSSPRLYLPPTLLSLPPPRASFLPAHADQSSPLPEPLCLFQDSYALLSESKNLPRISCATLQSSECRSWSNR